MTMNRRQMILGSAAATGAVLSSATARAAQGDAVPDARLMLCSQLGVIPGESLEEKMDNMAGWGFDGVELGGDIVGNEQRYQQAAANAGLTISAICWGSIGGALVSEDEDKRK